MNTHSLAPAPVEQGPLIFTRFDQAVTEYEEDSREEIARMSPASKNDLLLALLMKRSVDGLNHRCWDASVHLKWEDTIADIITDIAPRLTTR